MHNIYCWLKIPNECKKKTHLCVPAGLPCARLPHPDV